MTSLLLAIYCVSPATSCENIDHPSFLREAGSVQAPLYTTQKPFNIHYNINCQLEPKVPVFLEGRERPRPSAIYYHLMRKLNCISRGESQ